MARFIPDAKTQRWVVIAPARLKRPTQVREVEKPEQVVKKGEFFWRADCPFCYGNEEMTPPEIYRWRGNNHNNSTWMVRVVPNKFPITDTHEVVIHSPDHKFDIPDLPLSSIEVLFKVFRERYRSLSGTGQVLIYNNRGLQSGESLVHPHSQIAVFPRQIKLDVLPLEPIRNVIFENSHFITYCPDFSQWPYEVWIALKKCCEAGGGQDFGCTFGEVADEELIDLATIVQEILRRLLKLFPNLSYNFYIAPGDCWYLRIIPRLTERAGLELGTGVQVNPTDPAKAAEDLKGVKI